jgi:hypothetical protein
VPNSPCVLQQERLIQAQAVLQLDALGLGRLDAEHRLHGITDEGEHGVSDEADDEQNRDSLENAREDESGHEGLTGPGTTRLHPAPPIH